MWRRSKEIEDRYALASEKVVARGYILGGSALSLPAIIVVGVVMSARGFKVSCSYKKPLLETWEERAIPYELLSELGAMLIEFQERVHVIRRMK